MPLPDPQTARQFAVDTVATLRDAGFQALWAGGCVRDELLGLLPKDYDVATDATPEEIRRVFGKRRTLAIGQAFGVITVLGSKQAGQIEVATFRCDAKYTDGRHPDAVTFSTAEQDAFRRDFTINGLFFDPLEERVIDYVDGREDLLRGVLRAIGDPYARIAEDKLRMLRAVRMAATFSLNVHPDTLAAVQQKAADIVIVSPERITAELRRMLVHANRRRAAELLAETGLLTVVLPELDRPNGGGVATEELAWRQTLALLDRLDQPTFAVAFAALIREQVHEQPLDQESLERLCRRLKFANDERESAVFVLTHEQQVRHARTQPWPQLQRLLIRDRVEELLVYARAVAAVVDGNLDDIRFCERKLAQPIDQLNPPPLLTGGDLKQHGLRPGPVFKRILETVRDAQLEGRIDTPADALELARRLGDDESGGPLA